MDHASYLVSIYFFFIIMVKVDVKVRCTLSKLKEKWRKNTKKKYKAGVEM